MQNSPTEYLKPRIVDVDIVNDQRASYFGANGAWVWLYSW